MDPTRAHELLLQTLETELGGVSVYETAIRCAVHPDLSEEWTKYLGQTREHVRVTRELFAKIGLDPEKETPGRALVRAKGKALVAVMNSALKAGDPVGAQLVAAECVVDAETKDHGNWSLIGQLAKSAEGPWREALRAAHDEVEDEEDEHLYHTQGWCRELWIQALGLDAVLPPPEEKQHVKSMAGAAKAKANRGKS